MLNQTTLVLDARTARIICFTPTEPASMAQIEANLILSVATASLPEALKHENCYHYRYEHGQISYAGPKPRAKPQSLIEANRAALFKQLQVNLSRSWNLLPAWHTQATSPERAGKFSTVEAAYQARIESATTQAEIDELAKAIAAIDVA